MNAIVDSGCDVNLIPASLIKDQAMCRTKVKMTAINQTCVDILGETTFPFQLGLRTVNVAAVGSYQTPEMILGLDFLERFNCMCDFGNRIIHVNGETYPLYAESDYTETNGTGKSAG